MPDFCTCGAHLPPDARFCHKCGKPQFDEPTTEEQAIQEVAATPIAPPPLPPLEISFGNGTAVRVGFVAALVAVLLVIFPLPLPVVRITVSFIAAGFLAVFLYKRRTGQNLSLLGGARMGWITGVFSFTICMVQLTVGVLLSSSEGGVAAVLKQQVPPNDANAAQMLQLIQQPVGLALFMLIGLVGLFVLLTALPTLGGLLGAKVLPRKP